MWSMLWREQSKIYKSGNQFCLLFMLQLYTGCYVDELSIYKWTELWNIKGHFPEPWDLQACISSSPLPLPFCFTLDPTFAH